MVVHHNDSWNSAGQATSVLAEPAGKSLPANSDHSFLPIAPSSVAETGLPSKTVESLILKYLLNTGIVTGRQVSTHVRLPFIIVREVLDALRAQLMVAYRESAELGDYRYELAEAGLGRARQLTEQCTYIGSAPVRLEDYIDSVSTQSIERSQPRLQQLHAAFSDLTLPPALLSQLGQALNSGRALLLFGAPGNGKTSIAERLMDGIDELIWIPRCLSITNEVIRLYDPTVHEEVPVETADEVNAEKIDRRWVRIKRPTVVTGGELTLNMLECNHNPATGIYEASLQLKSNGGALVIDDFGHQQIAKSELLQRWIVPLEKQLDNLVLPSGRSIQIPFRQLLVFSTNLDPRQIADEAFLRRIPYKVEVFDPVPQEFSTLFTELATRMGFAFESRIVDYLLDTHYRQPGRPLRYAHASAILLQLKSLFEFHQCPFEINETSLDVAVYNYFAGL